jgi:hypothetical protein
MPGRGAEKGPGKKDARKKGQLSIPIRLIVKDECPFFLFGEARTREEVVAQEGACHGQDMVVPETVLHLAP